MSQEVSTNPRASKPLTSSNSVQPWSAETAADNLMDELFSDIDRILDGGSKLPTEPVKPEYVSLQSIVMPDLPAPPAVIPTQELVEPKPEPPETMAIEPRETAVVHTAIPPAKRSGGLVEKLLLAGGLISLLVTLGLLLANQQKLNLPGFLNFSGSSSQESQLPASDTQFVSYMLRSLQVIENKSKTNQKTAANATAPSNQPPINLQSLPLGNNRPLSPNQAPPVLERIYIPVYPPQAPAAPVPAQAVIPPTARVPVQVPSPIAKPPVQRRSPAVRQPAPSPAVRQPAPSPVGRTSTPSSVGKTSAPAPVRKTAAPSPVARLSPPPAPVALPALPPLPPPSAVIPSQTVASSLPGAKHTLVGLLELGDRSAALFDINGSTQRFNVGEGIGNSGWTLVSVANQEAVIRRNGEVRSVYVGQMF